MNSKSMISVSRLFLITTFTVAIFSFGEVSLAANNVSTNTNYDPIILADLDNVERRYERRERRDDRQDCRDDEGVVGDDKRDCKQDKRDDREEREDRRDDLRRD